MRVLVVEDEVRMAAVLRRGLEGEGIACRIAQSGEAGIAAAGEGAFDAIVLDAMLPGLDGFETCRRLRRDEVWVPILMLTARDSVEDRVAGLDSGADDYLVKPFAFSELLARLRALVRRGARERPTMLVAAGIALDPAARTVTRDGVPIELSTREFALLETLMRHAGQVMTRGQLREQVWNYDFPTRSNVVDVYVRYLRSKIDRPFGTRSIETIRGIGYRLRAGQ